MRNSSKEEGRKRKVVFFFFGNKRKAWVSRFVGRLSWILYASRFVFGSVRMDPDHAWLDHHALHVFLFWAGPV